MLYGSSPFVRTSESVHIARRIVHRVENDEYVPVADHDTNECAQPPLWVVVPAILQACNADDRVTHLIFGDLVQRHNLLRGRITDEKLSYP